MVMYNKKLLQKLQFCHSTVLPNLLCKQDIISKIHSANDWKYTKNFEGSGHKGSKTVFANFRENRVKDLHH